jgi:hypothetical protein
MKQHEWRERTEDGNVKYMRAQHFGSEWKLQSTLKTDSEWHVHDPITLEEWRMIRDVLFRKYQRRRGAWKEVEIIDKTIEDMETAEAEGAEAPPSDDAS